MKKTVEPNLIIKYEWNEDNKNGIDLDVLGESIAGFDTAIKQTVKVLKIRGDISVKVRIAEDKSIDFGVIIDIISGTLQIPFENTQAYLDFLALVGKQTATDGFELVSKTHEDLNALYAKYPFDAMLLGYGIVKLFAWAKKQKKTVILQDDDGKYLPKNYAIRLHKLIRKKRIFRKALRPFVDEQVSKIEVRAVYQPNRPATIDNNNFEDYLSEEEQILPEYKNGKVYRFTGTIVGLESSRGEYMKFKAEGIKREHSLFVVFPGNERNTEDFLEFYKKQILIEAEIVRKSFYQKPKLLIRKKPDLMQKPLL